MRRAYRAIIVVALAAAACGGAAVLASPAPTAPATVSASVPPSAQTGPAASGTTRVEGTVSTASATKVALMDNTALAIGPSTRIVRTDRASVADLKPGLFVAITAKQQPDNTLLASMVNIFPASLGTTIPAGQRPLPQGDLMTNAPIVSIDQVNGSSFEVTFPGGGAKVVLAPTVVITKQTDVKPEDIPTGTKIVATVRDAVALSIQIQSQ